jgi:hypothetical protein
MVDNPLAGISIPSLCDIAEEVVGRMGTSKIDLSNPLQRRRLKDYIEQALGMAINFELERALQAASSKAVTHVFRVMRDADYQAKRRLAAVARAARRVEAKQKKAEAEREARMDYSRRQIKPVEKEIIQ